MGQNIVQSLSTASLPYLLIPVNAIQVGKVSLSNIQNLRFIFNPWTADNNYSLLNRGDLLQSFQMQLYQKQNNIYAIFLCIMGI